jgi:hypothetical protein
MLRAPRSVPCWRIVFSAFRRSMNFAQARGQSRPNLIGLAARDDEGGPEADEFDTCRARGACWSCSVTEEYDIPDHENSVPMAPKDPFAGSIFGVPGFISSTARYRPWHANGWPHRENPSTAISRFQWVRCRFAYGRTRSTCRSEARTRRHLGPP